LLRQAVRIFNKIFEKLYLFPHKFVTILAIANNYAIQPNLENFRHHLSLYLEMEHLVVMSLVFFTDGVMFQNRAHQWPDIRTKDNPDKKYGLT